MKKSRLGCLSGYGFYATAALLVFVSGYSLLYGNRLFSPGPLNAQAGEFAGGVRSHAEIEDCAVCHTAFWDTELMSDRCLKCHTGVGKQLGEDKGLHAALLEGSGFLCYECHTEHNGPLAALTVFDTTGFQHDIVGYSLAGHITHQSGRMFTCTDCHEDGLNSLNPDVCAGCHGSLDVDFMIAHIGLFGSECLACHDGLDRYGSDFDHDSLAFPLLFQHAKAGCQECHQGAKTKADLVDTPSNCFACHSREDAHQGEFGQNCEECHTPQGWDQAVVDHTKTNFPLLGKHLEVDCHVCHQDHVFKGTPQLCIACHQKEDAHEGRYGENCGECHTPDGWDQVDFDHAQTAFPLTGLHIPVDCLVCHKSGVFKGTPAECYACHAQNDVHEGEFGRACATCHSPSGWLPSTFDHSKAAFTLTGAHQAATCSSCHSKGVFKGTPRDCYSCHARDDAHNGQLGKDCAACHSTAGWKPSTFNHSNTAFALTGAHRVAACSGCHANGGYKGTPRDCASCHAEPGYHQGLFGYDCAACHSTTAWLPAAYNQAHTFPINHGRANNSCRECHPQALDRYTCYSCHSRSEIEDEHKEEGIGDYSDCVSCHPTGEEPDD